MLRKLSRTHVLSVASAATLAALGAVARADTIISSFTPGDLVVLRGGDATNSNTTGGNAFNGQVSAYLDEYTTTGTYVGTIPAGSGLTLPGQGVVSHEGILNNSVDGHSLVFGGYTTPAGTTARATDGTQTEVVGVIGNTAASLNTSTQISPAQSTGQFIRGVATVDGTSFYVAAKNPNDGLEYVNGVGAGASVTILQSTTDWRDLIIGNNTLYGGTGSSSVGAHGAYQIGSAGALPTAATPANTLLTNYSGGQSASALALLNIATSDASAQTQNGYNVLYTVGDQSSPGITKYYFDGTMWQHANLQVTLNASNNVSNPTGIVAQIDPNNAGWIDLYVSGSNGIYSYVDSSGDPLTGLSANAFTQIVTPGADQAFYGLANAPTAVPEPAMLGLIAVAASAILARRRRV